MRFVLAGLLVLIACTAQANSDTPPSEFDLRVAETALVRKFKEDPEAFVAAQARLFAQKTTLDTPLADALVAEATRRFREISANISTAGLSRSQIRRLDSRIVSIALKNALVDVVGSQVSTTLKQEKERLTAAGFVLDYLEIRDAQDLSKSYVEADSAVILVAAKLGRARLIDNLVIELKR